MSFDYLDADGIPHYDADNSTVVLWRRLMVQFMDTCHASGVHPITAATMAANMAGYIIGKAEQVPDERRQEYARQLADILIRKAKQTQDLRE